MKTDTCRTCGATILWCVTQKGKRMPLDNEPSSAGKFVLEFERQANGESIPKAVFIGDRPYGGERYTSHFGTCPQAKEHSGRPRGAPNMGRADAACRPDGQGYCATHPTCELVRTVLETLRARVR